MHRPSCAMFNVQFPLKSQLKSIDKSQSVCMTLNRYDNIIVMGGFNNNVNKDEEIHYDELDELR